MGKPLADKKFYGFRLAKLEREDKLNYPLFQKVMAHLAAAHEFMEFLKADSGLSQVHVTELSEMSDDLAAMHKDLRTVYQEVTKTKEHGAPLTYSLHDSKE